MKLGEKIEAASEVPVDDHPAVRPRRLLSRLGVALVLFAIFANILWLGVLGWGGWELINRIYENLR